VTLSRRSLRAGCLAILVAFAVMPLYWMLVIALKGEPNPLGSGDPWWPASPTLAHYVDVVRSPLVARWMLNTAVVTGATLLVSLVSSLLAAYALAYLDVPFSRGIVLALFATYLVPQGVLFVPLVRTLSRLHLTNTLVSLILTYPGLVIPFGTWVLWSLFVSLPPDLVDTARIEGAGVLVVLRRVLLPMAWPGLAAVAIFAVAVVFNDFLYAFTFISRADSTTLMGGIGITNADVGDPGFEFAAITLGMVPVAIACAFFADVYARGLGTGVIDR
jgi:ABC-type glycerol-3-phosphate transport system permease component